MSLSRTAMTQDEATQLASIIDTSHLPVHVKRVTNENIVEVQDDVTGYVLPVVSAEHWKQYAKQQGDSNAIDEFANAGVALLSQLDKMLEGLRFERDNLMEQAEKVDAQVTHYQTQRDAIESAIKAADAISLLATVRGVKVTPPTPQPRRKRSFSGSTQLNWVREKLSTSEPVRVGDLADEWANLANVTRHQAIKSISGTLSRLTKEDMQYDRVAQGTYQFIPAPVQDER